MKNILVAVDLKRSSQLLVDTAAILAEKFTSKVWVLHIAAPEPDYIGNNTEPRYIREVLAKELREEHKIVQQYAGQLQKKGIEAVGLLIAGATITTLLNEMKKLGTDLLIIGHHKHGFFYKIFGEVTDIPLMKKSNVPVLMVPLSDDE